jgi:hypothetical protein
VCHRGAKLSTLLGAKLSTFLIFETQKLFSLKIKLTFVILLTVYACIITVVSSKRCAWIEKEHYEMTAPM